MTNGPTLGRSRKEKVKKTMKKQRQKEEKLIKNIEREGFLAADQD